MKMSYIAQRYYHLVLSSGHRMNSVYAILPAAGRITDIASLVIYPVNSLDTGTVSLIGNVQYRFFSHVLKKNNLITFHTF